MSDRLPRFACVLALFALTSFTAAFPTASHAQAPPPAAAAGTDSLVLQPGPEGKDAYVDSWYPGQNYGAHNYFFGIGLPGVGRAFAEFDLSGLPADAVVTAATLSLWGRYMDGSISFDPAAAPWDEMTVNWSNQPAPVTPSLGVSYPISRGPVSGPCYMGCIQTFDVTGIVAAWVAGTVPNHGFRIFANTPGYGWMVASSDNATAGDRPRLSVRFESSTPAARTSWGRLKAMYR